MKNQHPCLGVARTPSNPISALWQIIYRNLLLSPTRFRFQRCCARVSFFKDGDNKHTAHIRQTEKEERHHLFLQTLSKPTLGKKHAHRMGEPTIPVSWGMETRLSSDSNESLQKSAFLNSCRTATGWSYEGCAPFSQSILSDCLQKQDVGNVSTHRHTHIGSRFDRLHGCHFLLINTHFHRHRRYSVRASGAWMCLSSRGCVPSHPNDVPVATREASHSCRQRR